MTEPEQMLEVYQFEGCPFCSKVRQKMTDLGIDFIARAVDPQDRSRVEEVSGQTNVPVLVDPNKDTVMPESDDIVEYLDEHYS
ncbi:glutathione S-transferase N-terminal domain-containing protein [Candidatus Nanohalococcus occultus]|uniref:Glutaredoxin n=1 Tax=Candidatus Nanohalococcus occultus TaxID=2978047 RepID=A0ABY8CJ89_9ARCH|nr:Glutaredoxin [Candidatus Nanohaloarchaeota archaeon SVXNc]